MTHDRPPAEDPLDITRVLAGVTLAGGFFKDRFGRVRRSFEVTMIGRWEEPADGAGDGRVFVLDEAFHYDNGERERRTWRVMPGRDGVFTATCADCIGIAHGVASSGSWRMRYRFRLKMGRRALAVAFDDCVYRVDDRVAVNRTVVRKWGIKLGEVVIVFERQDVQTDRANTAFADAAE
jgi:Protein of unknown function (DUF3833)